MGDFRQELEDISPLLASWPKEKNNEAAPKEYFDKLEEMVMSHAYFPKYTLDENSVPEHYFDRLEEEIINKSNSNSKPTIIKWFYYAAAAMFLGLISIVAIKTQPTSQPTEIAYQSLQLEDVEVLDYLIEDIDMVAEFGLLDEEDVYVVDETYFYNQNNEEYFFD